MYPDRPPRYVARSGGARRSHFRLSLLLALAVVSATALGAGAGPALGDGGSGSNWAGYVAGRPGVHFTQVSASWVEPAVSCRPGAPAYVSSWVGLGGDRTPALEQIGADAACGADGQATYSAWLELVPTVSAAVDLPIRPGDRVSASVTVTGHAVRLSMTNRTLGTSFVRRLRAAAVDVSSAEWIVEAPDVCGDGAAASCHASTLADFASISFTQARATVSGHTGGVGDRAWSATPYTLATSGSPLRGPRSAAGLRRAVPGALLAAGDAFAVDFAAPGPRAGPVG